MILKNRLQIMWPVLFLRKLNISVILDFTKIEYDRYRQQDKRKFVK